MRKVRTPEGSRYYDLPIGAPITADAIARARTRSSDRGRAIGQAKARAKGGGTAAARGGSSGPGRSRSASPAAAKTLPGVQHDSAGRRVKTATPAPQLKIAPSLQAQVDARKVSSPIGNSRVSYEVSPDETVQVDTPQGRVTLDDSLQDALLERLEANRGGPRSGQSYDAAAHSDHGVTGKAPSARPEDVEIGGYIGLRDEGRLTHLKRLSANEWAGDDTAWGGGLTYDMSTVRDADARGEIVPVDALPANVTFDKATKAASGTSPEAPTIEAERPAFEAPPFSPMNEFDAAERDKSTQYAAEMALAGETPPAGNAQVADSRTYNTAEEAARSIQARAIAVEPEITENLVGYADEFDLEMVWLGFRLKEMGSLLRKIKTEQEETGGTFNEVTADIKDAVRYTMKGDEDNLVESMRKTLEEFAAKGYKIRAKNTWKPGSPYKGVNAQMQSPDGYKFELQFHTDKSLEVKDVNHKLYEDQRVLDSSDPEFKRLAKVMADNAESIPSPAGMEDFEFDNREA